MEKGRGRIASGSVATCGVRRGQTNLPNPHNGIGNEDQEDDKGFNKGGNSLFTFLKPGQHLESKERENNRKWSPSNR